MKKFLLASLFFLFPISALAVPTKPEQFEKLENEFSLACQEYGAESSHGFLVYGRKECVSKGGRQGFPSNLLGQRLH